MLEGIARLGCFVDSQSNYAAAHESGRKEHYVVAVHGRRTAGVLESNDRILGIHQCCLGLVVKTVEDGDFFVAAPSEHDGRGEAGRTAINHDCGRWWRDEGWGEALKSSIGRWMGRLKWIGRRDAGSRAPDTSTSQTAPAPRF